MTTPLESTLAAVLGLHHAAVTPIGDGLEGHYWTCTCGARESSGLRWTAMAAMNKADLHVAAAILAAIPAAAHVAELEAALAAAEARLRAVDALAVTWETSGPYYPGAFYAEASAYASGRDDQKEVCADDLRDTLAAALTTPPQPAP